MTDNPLRKAAQPLEPMDSVKARQWAAMAKERGNFDKAALWEAHAEKLARQETGRA